MSENGVRALFERWRQSLSKAFREPSRLGFQAREASEILAERLACSSLRFRIAPLREESAAALRALTDHPAITAAISFLKSPFTLDDATTLMGANYTGTDCFLGVRRRADNALVAVIGAHLRGESMVEIGYWVGPAYQGQGYATEVLAALVARIADIMPERQIAAECSPENQASLRVLEKLGFENTGMSGARPGRAVFVLRGAAQGAHTGHPTF